MAIDVRYYDKDREKLFKFEEKLHEALCGSPAYINSEIVLTDIDDAIKDDPNCGKDGYMFHNIIGNGNSHDIVLVVDNTTDTIDAKPYLSDK